MGPELLDENQIYFDQIRQSAHNLHSLVTESLEYVKIDQNQSEKNWVDLNLLMEEIQRDYQPEYPDARIESTALPHVFGQKSLFSKLLGNLIENGLKYNQQEHKLIQIQHTILPESLEITISDNGIGIEEAYHDRIFEMYQRLHPATRYQGSGIGLAQCKKIVASLGGSIHLASNPGKGSTFCIKLPIAITRTSESLV